MKKVEATGKTVEEAINSALEQLNVSKGETDIEVIEEAGKSFLGLFGSRLARVSVSLKDGAKPQVNAASQADKPQAAMTAAKQDVDFDADADYLRMATFLKEVSARLGAPVQPQPQMREDAILVTLTGEDMGRLIGHRGETLDALQYLAGQVYNQKRDTYCRVVLDSENYRSKREAVLVELSAKLANKAVRNGRRVELEPMNAYERRIMHAALQNDDRVTTHSEGEEPRRFMVITPK